MTYILATRQFRAQMFLHPRVPENLGCNTQTSNHITQLCGCQSVCVSHVRCASEAGVCICMCGRIRTDLFLCLKQHLTDLVSMYVLDYDRHPVNNLYLIGRLFSSLQILNLMMQASAEQQWGRLISGLRRLIFFSSRLKLQTVLSLGLCLLWRQQKQILWNRNTTLMDTFCYSMLFYT